MERMIEAIGYGATILVPLLALWAIASLYSLQTGRQCAVTECVYYVVLLLVSGVTLRTILADDSCWLVHTASLCAMVIAGVMRRPQDEYQFNFADETLVSLRLRESDAIQ